METKTCNRCEKTMPVEEFYRHPQTLDGRMGQCKECKKAAARAYNKTPAGRNNDKRKYKKHKEKILRRNSKYREQNREQILEQQQRYYEENGEHVKELKRQWYAENHDQACQQRREYQKTPHGKESHQRGMKRYRERHPDKYHAHMTLNNAVNRGRIKRQPCEVCGDIEAEGHHEDYSQPLDVRWLCFEHHREVAHGQTVAKKVLTF